MCNLDEAACLRDVGHVAECQITLLESERAAILEDLVTHVSILLPALISTQEFTTGAFRLDQVPQVGAEDRLTS